MSETYVRIKGDYYQDEMAGQTAVLVEKNLGILSGRDLYEESLHGILKPDEIYKANFQIINLCEV